MLPFNRYQKNKEGSMRTVPLLHSLRINKLLVEKPAVFCLSGNCSLQHCPINTI
jgi:hypothetical protein